MIFIKQKVKKALLAGIVTLLSFTSIKAQDGKQLFQGNCQSCHAINKQLTGPALAGLETRGPWTDRKNLYKWIHNPAAFIPTTPYTKELQAQFGGQIMPAFPQLAEGDIDAIVDYINKTAAADAAPKTDTTGAGGAAAADSGGQSAVVFGIISLVLALVALILLQVNSNLKKLSDDKEGILRPDPVPFYRNKIYISLLALVLFVVGGYFVSKGAINMGRQKGYAPDQPIFYSHKVHAGVNQINCLYCHGSAWESKHAAIPSVNICMNCHKAINTYEKGPKLYDQAGNEINGTQEIQKLYKYAGFTAGQAWDPAKATPIEWVKIHNLPDHVYFNHAQHVNAGKVACQTCHGNIQEMDVVEQKADLSMGWCINCHRESKVNFNNRSDSTGNKFYSIYEKFHNDLKSGKMDSVTVKDIGGTQCMKCHY
ncbi:quinol:cytochrome c oxidoreductase pentaheme cytochrome subunit [Cnuella takakiae]|uniref:Quinol:cytochrome c oxidoreductase pentaheme cytochrome subunit n=1 Tax=Cnuella takakiae TaxID=1302690 RepID=A0A1M5FBC8_9BACT|nr:c-type cytochrome [Cnuella takakiae]OLY91044.1 cytochrome C [Cnuella takakiae]SHF88749.1 quinol:cytochrome c oxidoreductase pentaheme cytochrome subunit [Cnuella takakiae]